MHPWIYDTETRTIRFVGPTPQPSAFDLAWSWIQWGLIIVSCLVVAGVVAVILFNLYKALRFALYDIADRNTISAVKALDINQKEITLSALARDAALVKPDENGLFPLPASMIDSPEVAGQAIMLAAQHINTKLPVALPQPVPQTITYSPHYAPHLSNRSENIGGQMMLEDSARTQPARNFLDLYNNGQLPSNGFLMGFDLSTDQPIHATWKDLYSALVGGASGSGKSTLIRSVLAQSAIQGGQFVVLDRHYASGEESLGASLQPLRSRMLCDVAASENEMLDALHFVRDIGQRRLDGKDNDRSPVVLIVDEATGLMARSNIAEQLTNILGMIAQETRKVGVFSLCIGQNFSGEIFPTLTRNSFVSMLSCRTRRDVARVMSGNTEFAQIAEGLTIGQAVWMNPAGEVMQMAVPNCTQEMVEVVAKRLESPKTQLANSLVVEPLRQPLRKVLRESLQEDENKVDSEVGSLTAKQRHALEMFKHGKSKTNIIDEVWHTKGGDAFQKASVEFEEALRQALTI